MTDRRRDGVGGHILFGDNLKDVLGLTNQEQTEQMTVTAPTIQIKLCIPGGIEAGVFMTPSWAVGGRRM